MPRIYVTFPPSAMNLIEVFAEKNDMTLSAAVAYLTSAGIRWSGLLNEDGSINEDWTPDQLELPRYVVRLTTPPWGGKREDAGRKPSQ